MSRWGALPALALADFRDRVRRRSFLAVLAAAAFLGLQAIQGNVLVVVGGRTGEPSSAWAGALMTMVAATFLSLAGFWVVKGSVGRDRATGVGQILAATPMPKTAYTLAKAASHFLVLAAMAGVLALAALVLLLVAPGSPPIRPLEILGPLVLFALPMLALVAALAVLFETLPPLAGGFGNLVWFFVWGALLVVPLETRSIDLMGVATFQREMGAAVRALDPKADDGFAITLAGDAAVRVEGRFRWDGFPPGAVSWLERAQVALIALVVALAAALPFDRFDPARRRLRRRPAVAAGAEPSPAAAGPPAPARALPPLAASQRDPGVLSLAWAELRMTLASMPKLWKLGAAGLCVAGLAIPPVEGAPGALLAALLWSALVWSGLGVREKEHGVEALLASAPRARGRQLPGLLLAGFAAGLLPAAGALLRLLAGGRVAAAAGAVTGLAAMAVLGLALGLLSRGPRLFEGLYVSLWYLGPANRVPMLDFAGLSAPARAAGAPWIFLALAGMLLVAGLAAERLRAADAGARFA